MDQQSDDEDQELDGAPEAGAGRSEESQEVAPVAGSDGEASQAANQNGSREIPIGKPIDEETFDKLKRRAEVADPENDIPPPREEG